MVVVPHRVHYTVEDYLEFEDGNEAKHEYLDGQILAMAGGTPEHAALSLAFGALVANQLKGGRCRAYSSDLRVRIAPTTLITYPDAAVICGPADKDPAAPSAVTNPTLLAEVLSPSTAEYDRTDKFDHYRQLKSLQQYVLIDPKTETVELRTRGPNGAWTSATHRAGDSLELASIGVRFEVKELFAMATEPRA